MGNTIWGDGSASKLLAMLTIPPEFDRHHPFANLIWWLITVPKTGGLELADPAVSTNMHFPGLGRESGPVLQTCKYTNFPPYIFPH